MDKALIILAPGGLGNQLFAVAAALHISEKNEQRILLLSDSKELVRKFKQISIAGMSQPKVRIVYSRNLNMWLNKLSSRVIILTRKFPKIEKFIVRKFRTELVPWKFPYDLLEKPFSNFWILRGYFQDVTLLYELSTSTKQALACLFDMDPTSDSLHKNDYPESIGVHIRRGDYATIPSYGVLSTFYFQRLISHYRRDTTTVMVASDDSSILGQFKVKGSEVLLDARYYSPLETLKALGKSDIFIMSNSTFSFWVGWLVNLRGGLVIRPNPWFKANEVPEKYLLLNEFINAPSEFET